MNGPFILAQANIPGPSGTAPQKVIKLVKPQGSQAITVPIDGATTIDLSDITAERLTLVHVGDRLVVLFDNGSTISLDPFYDANGNPLPNVTIELAQDRFITGDEFGSLFPITTDQSVLPAAGATPGSSSSPYFDQQTIVTPLGGTDTGTPPPPNGAPNFFTLASFATQGPASSAAGGDTTVPAGTGTPDLVAASDSGRSSTDNLTNVTAPTFSVGLAASTSVGDTVELLLNGASFATPVLHTVTAADVLTGTVFLTVTAGDLGTDGTKAVSAKFLDGTGNTSTTGSLSFVLDTTTPTGGTPDLVAGSDSGISSTDDITNATSPTFTVGLNGNVAAGDTVELLLGGSSLGTPIVHTITAADVLAGSVSLTVASGDLGTDGSKSISAQFTDTAGNTSTTGSLSFVLDTTTRRPLQCLLLEISSQAWMK